MNRKIYDDWLVKIRTFSLVSKQFNLLDCLIIISFALFIILALFSASTLRPLSGDGAFWAFKITMYNNCVIDGPHNRFFSCLIQAPSLFAVNNFSNYLSPHMISRIFSYSFVLGPILSLLGTFYILRIQRRLCYIVFPILSYALATLPTVSFAVGASINSLAIFWPLFFLVLFKKETVAQQIWIIVLSAMLLFSYELSIIFTFLLLGLTIYFMKKQSLTLYRIIDILVFSVLLLYFCNYLFVNPHRMTEREISYSVRSFFNINYYQDIIQLYSLLFTVLLTMLLLTSKKGLRQVFFFCLAAIGCYAFYQSLIQLTDHSYDARLYAIPKATLIALAAIIVMIRKEERILIHKSFLLLIILALFPTSIFDFKNSMFWKHSLDRFENILEKDRCIAVGEEFFLNDHKNRIILPWTVLYLSVDLAKENVIDRIAYLKSQIDGKEYDYDLCKSVWKDKFFSHIERKFFSAPIKANSMSYATSIIKPSFNLLPVVGTVPQIPALYLIHPNDNYRTEKIYMKKGRTYLLSLSGLRLITNSKDLAGITLNIGADFFHLPAKGTAIIDHKIKFKAPRDDYYQLNVLNNSTIDSYGIFYLQVTN